MLFLPATADTIAGFIAAAEAAPEELSTIANVMSAPPMPFLPEDVVGQPIILAILAYAGDAADGERAIAPFRALAKPLADMVQPMPYPQIYPPDDESYRPTAAAVNMFIDHVDTGVAQTILEFLNAIEAPVRVAQLRVLGGAMARVPAEATAFAHRDARIMVNLAAFYGPDDRAEKEAWVADFQRALDQGDRRVYSNFLGDEGEARVRAAYPGATWDRLVAVKQQYDPDNLFRLNQNIPPTGAQS
jgi:FAD/FMN-containing dehydrogenase